MDCLFSEDKEFPETQVDLEEEYHQVKGEGWWALYLGGEGLLLALASSQACVQTGSGHGGVGRHEVLEPLSGRTSHPSQA